MKKFLIKLDYEDELNAEDEQNAIIDFFNNTINDTQTDATSWLEEHLTIKELCPDCNTPLENKMIDLDGTNLEERQVCEKCNYGYPNLK